MRVMHKNTCMQMLFSQTGSFKKQSQKKPEREEIESDQTVDLITAFSGVIPWAGVEEAKKAAGKVFHQEDQNGINASTKKYSQLFQIAGYNRNQGTESVNGKHKQ